MVLLSLVSNDDQRLDQNVLRNRLSRSLTMVCGIPKCTHFRSNKSLVVASTKMLFLQATRIAILEKRSTTTKTQSFPLLVDERPNMDEFPQPIRSRQRGVQTMFLSGQFGNSTGGARPDILVDILSKFWPVKMFLQHDHYLFDAKVSCHPTIVSFSNQLRMLA
jgi:hypothetical protein